jgi:hypothetical protein
MRRLLLIGLVLVLAAGCKKGTRAAKGTQAQPTAPSNGPSVHAPTGVVINPGSGGGSGGAVQAVRQAVTRTVNLVQLDQLRTFIETTSVGSSQIPSAEQITTELQRDARQLHKLVQDGAIVLTGTRSHEGIWAYTADRQDAAGQHLVVTASRVDRIPETELDQRLAQQGTPRAKGGKPSR